MTNPYASSAVEEEEGSTESNRAKDKNIKLLLLHFFLRCIKNSWWKRAWLIASILSIEVKKNIPLRLIRGHSYLTSKPLVTRGARVAQMDLQQGPGEPREHGAHTDVYGQCRDGVTGQPGASR